MLGSRSGLFGRKLHALIPFGVLACAFGATSAQAGLQLYNGSWVAESFGNDRVAATASGTHMGTDASEFFSFFGMPQGVLCNPGIPRCSFAASPTSKGVFQPNPKNPAACVPLTKTIGTGGPWTTSVRPAKGATPKTLTTTNMGFQFLVPLESAPRYRNPFFFTAGGAPKATDCTAYTTVGGMNATAPLTTNDPLRGVVMKGAPLTGSGKVNTFTAAAGGAFTIGPAPPTAFPYGTKGIAGGFRRTTTGEFNNIPPYLYSYTYATLRNASGFFSQGGGFFTYSAAQTAVSLPYSTAMGKVATINVKAGPNRFGGVMRLLGQLTTKVCYYRNGGCSLGGADWLYQYIGESAPVAGGVVTGPYNKTHMVNYYHTALMVVSKLTVKARRFPWTTGDITVKAFRGPHKTIERRGGYDSRTSVSGQGQIQLVSPVLTTWFQNCCKFETGGIAVMRLEFLPEPRYWMMLVGGLSLLGVLYRFRGR